jgi:hypothetical protein
MSMSVIKAEKPTNIVVGVGVKMGTLSATALHPPRLMEA